ncbi:hypothetical protein ASPBRDRAFT_314741 [Aspergillus brasiliensis CBS 101740]|uniref:Uncharacterized protein n=1 Tax=Aspergillus brasiliensis (strain CBS 101740 / IMI 381727 / IBT 21946) TaxID=767769 RepID=A0A1L9UB61_ASPBC|nr:hypothetical protein ASPBRDRAFT_314741 [Aspergillus brasiliensis CBS 101740]
MHLILLIMNPQPTKSEPRLPNKVLLLRCGNCNLHRYHIRTPTLREALGIRVTYLVQTFSNFTMIGTGFLVTPFAIYARLLDLLNSQYKQLEQFLSSRDDYFTS